MKIAAVQMVSGASLAANLAQARGLLAQARDAGAELAVLPEYFAAMGHSDQDKLAQAEPLGSGPVQDFLADAARTLGLWIVGGTLPLRTGDATRVTNSSLAFAPTGERVARYDKIHLFQFENGRERYEEARVVAAGRQPVTLDIGARDGSLWRVGLSVCYDLRFPELYRALSQAGADLLLVPSAFTYTTGQAHWELLLRARAIENLAYVLAPAQGGQHENGRRTWGHSMCIDPWGQVQAQQAQGPGVVLGTLERPRMQAWRQQLPAREHRIL
ncbi:MAG: acyltransferase [Comamonadaceae bacterium SCN 68-20]|jgi:nitrilase|nr:carbon-nitrogen hydrolase family protein [Comamonadaceae bacterium]ODU59721.1 MAG: acyltransferase [Comamonadaceae bacterium SCN 68-20]OJX35621.1 MAG: acyltransferase [Burkholderiales bacterium 68-20]